MTSPVVYVVHKARPHPATPAIKYRRQLRTSTVTAPDTGGTTFSLGPAGAAGSDGCGSGSTAGVEAGTLSCGGVAETTGCEGLVASVDA